MRLRSTLTLTCLGLTFGYLAVPAFAQDEPAKEEPSLSDMKANAKTGPTPIPSPFDAFLALDLISKDKPVDWNDVLNHGIVAKDPEQYEDKTAVALMLGLKISDGLITIKAQDAEELNNVSRSIEVLAKKLGISEADMSRAEKVRKMASDDDWLGVFLELGFLQTDILSNLGEDTSKDQRALILSAGWIQGANYASYAIANNYSPEASNILREPSLVSSLHEDLLNTSSEIQQDEAVKALIAGLKGLKDTVDIGKDETLTKEQVEQIGTTSAALVDQIKQNS